MSSSFGLLRLPRSVTFASGAVTALPRQVADTGRRAAICVDPALAQTPAFRHAHQGIRASGVATMLITDVHPELPIESVHRAAAALAGFEPDLVVGYGGGSSLDLAKLLALLAVHDRPLPDFYGENKVPGPVLPVIAVPTTAGTGSEATPVAVLTDPSRELKVGVSSPHLVPHAAIVDPALTLGAPPPVIAYAGADALVHAVEAATAIRPERRLDDRLPVFVGENDLGTPLALIAVRHLTENLSAAVTRPDDLAPREGLALGSLLAGMAFGAAGTHLSHAIQYPVGAMTSTPHGLGTGMLLPYVLEAILPDATARVAAVGRAMNVTGEDETSLARAAIARIRQILQSIGVPRTLAEIGLAEAALPRVTELACGVTRLAGNSPVGAEPDLVESIVRAAFAGTTGRWER